MNGRVGNAQICSNAVKTWRAFIVCLSAPYSAGAHPGIDPNPQKAGSITRWTKAYWEAVHPFDLSGAYPNFMMDDEGDARLRATYGDNYMRLGAVKHKFDNSNLFRVNQNIRPVA